MKDDFLKDLRILVATPNSVTQISIFLDQNAQYLDELEDQDIHQLLLYDNKDPDNIERCSLFQDMQNNFDLGHVDLLLSTLNQWMNKKFLDNLTEYIVNQSDCKDILNLLHKNPLLTLLNLKEGDIYTILDHVDQDNNTILDLVISKSLHYTHKGEYEILSMLVHYGVFDILNEPNPYRAFLIKHTQDVVDSVYPRPKLPLIKYMFEQNLFPEDTKFSIWYHDIREDDNEFFMQLSNKFIIETSLEYHACFAQFHQYVHIYPDVIKYLYNTYQLKFTGDIPHIRCQSPVWDSILFNTDGFTHLCKFGSALASNKWNATEVLYKVLSVIQDPDLVDSINYVALENLLDSISGSIATHDLTIVRFLQDIAYNNQSHGQLNNSQSSIVATVIGDIFNTSDEDET